MCWCNGVDEKFEQTKRLIQIRDMAAEQIRELESIRQTRDLILAERLRLERLQREHDRIQTAITENETESSKK